MSYKLPIYSGTGANLTLEPAPIVTLANGKKVRITRADENEVVFDRIGGESACVISGAEFADLAAVVTHIENPPAKFETPVALSRLEFFSRLTDAEKLAVLNSDDSGVVIFRTMFLAADFIDRADSRMIDGLGYLAGLGLIGASRPAQLLAA
jgi:hypothetical protein